MSINGALWSSTLLASLTAAGMTGSKLSDFCDAVGNGSATHVVGKDFTTSDIGQTPGDGVGTGTGIIGISASAISAAIYSYAVASFGQAGDKLQDFCDAIGQACVSMMANATLDSTHNPVYLGTGTIDIGSISVVGTDWGSDIELAGALSGSKWPDFAQAIGKGQADEILANGTGDISITGSPTGPPVPGSGTGTGLIS